MLADLLESSWLDDACRRISRLVLSWHIPSPYVSTIALVFADSVKVVQSVGGPLDHECVANPHHDLDGQLISKQTKNVAQMAGQVGWQEQGVSVDMGHRHQAFAIHR